MGRYFIHLAYNGAGYCGWQTQPGLPTVQQTLEEALGTLLRQKIAVVGCGRTDTGVHASDFYAHFVLEEDLKMKGEELTFKMNSFLPPDIAIYEIFPVADNAHARFDATARTYQYHVSDRRLPFRQGQYCRIYFKPDIEKMNEAARVLALQNEYVQLLGEAGSVLALYAWFTVLGILAIVGVITWIIVLARKRIHIYRTEEQVEKGMKYAWKNRGMIVFLVATIALFVLNYLSMIIPAMK